MPDLRMLLIILVTGRASSGANSIVTFLGRSCWTEDLGFLADLIVKKVSYSDTSGGHSVDFNLFCTLAGSWEVSSGLNSWLIFFYIYYSKQLN